MTERCGEVYDSSDEYSRDDRIETYYQGWGAREMAERIVELEDELGADVDGMCTGMYADVAEARAEVERLASLVGYWEHRAEEAQANASRLRTERDEYREELAKIADFDEWELSAWSHPSPVRTLVTDVRPYAAQERDRYRLAWISARRRAADEANFGMEALALRDEEIRRLKAELKASRQSFDAPRLEYAGEDEDGEVWRLAKP